MLPEAPGATLQAQPEGWMVSLWVDTAWPIFARLSMTAWPAPASAR